MVRVLLVSLSILFTYPILAQISHGGSPLFFLPKSGEGLKSALNDTSLFVEMPSFNVDSLIAEDKLNESNMRGASRFAHKFFKTLEIGKSGHNFTLDDGTEVWQVGIRSNGAYSINVLFSEFYIPDGGMLFLYSADLTHVLGSFTHENNSDDGLLPVSPVSGDEIIVEYRQPASTTERARLKITEVNHDYRGVLRREPYNQNMNIFNCMPDILCSEAKDGDEHRGVVLLIINGTLLCSGSMINNTSNDGTPYLLTAMHCLSYSSGSPVHQNMSDYIYRAGTVVAFFNYNRPVCGTRMRGVEEMSVAGADALCIIEPLDIALIKLKNSPPNHYQAFYSGWNIDPAVHNKMSFATNIHHPNGDLKKFSKTTQKLSYASTNSSVMFETGAFWGVPAWTTGSTHGGSSGSPLFDDNNLIIGSLTAGDSYCSGDVPNGKSDIFSRLHRGWKYREDVDSLRLDKWLDSANTGALVCLGMEAGNESLSQASNANYNKGDYLEMSTVGASSDFLFGANLRNTTEFAEIFEAEDSCRVIGVFVLTPAMSFPSETIKLHLYGADDDGKPGDKLASAIFRPRFTNYTSGNFYEVNKSMDQGAESFVAWDAQPRVGKSFFVGYELPNAESPFLLYNTKFGDNRRGMAWINDPLNGWMGVADYSPLRINTALAIKVLTDGVVYSDTAVIQRSDINMHYNYKEKTLYYPAEADEEGVVRLYDISGRLLFEISFNSVINESLPPGIARNTMGIFHLKSNRRNLKLKVIF